MVAVSGPSWRLAPSLVSMVGEANRVAPQRSRVSDGSIGDAAHAARDSFHNPRDGFVDAVDLTHDPADGWDVHARARELVARGDSRLDHVISNRQVWSVVNPFWRAYDGSNPHDKHAHFAVKRGAAGRVGTRDWWPTVPVDDTTPPPLIPSFSQEAPLYFLSAKSNANVWFFEPGRRTLVSDADRAQLAKAAGIPNVVGEVSDGFFGNVAEGRTAHQ